jgi:hypothetical protein
MIKKVLIVLFVTLMGLTACSTSTSPAPQPSETRTYEPPAMTDEELFIENIRQYDYNSIIAYATDADLLELGWSVCDVLDYYTIEDVLVELAMSADLTTDEDYEFAGIIIGVSVVELCPRHLAEVDAYLD